jgi:uncharacterized protein YjdB
VRVRPEKLKLEVGQRGQLSAEALDQNGRVISGVTFTWSSSNPLVAAVSGSGQVQALLPGSATITVTAGGVRGGATVEVQRD